MNNLSVFISNFLKHFPYFAGGERKIANNFSSSEIQIADQPN